MIWATGLAWSGNEPDAGKNKDKTPCTHKTVQIVVPLEEIDALVVVPGESHRVRELGLFDKVAGQRHYPWVTAEGFP
jgi:hypothetical protein